MGRKALTMTKLQTTLTTSDDELYMRYEGQSGPQEVRLTLNLDTGELSAAYWPEIGPSKSMRAFNRRDIEWSIPPLKVHALKALFDQVSTDAQTILDDSTVQWDGNNMSGELGNDAELSDVRIESTVSGGWSSADVYEVWEAASYLEPCFPDEFDITAKTTDEQLEEKASEIVNEAPADVNLDKDDICKRLTDWRDDLKDDDEDE